MEELYVYFLGQPFRFRIRSPSALCFPVGDIRACKILPLERLLSSSFRMVNDKEIERFRFADESPMPNRLASSLEVKKPSPVLSTCFRFVFVDTESRRDVVIITWISSNGSNQVRATTTFFSHMVNVMNEINSCTLSDKFILLRYLPLPELWDLGTLPSLQANQARIKVWRATVQSEVCPTLCPS